MPLAVALVAVATFARTLGFGLVWDDPKLLGVLSERLLGGGLPGCSPPTSGSTRPCRSASTGR